MLYVIFLICGTVKYGTDASHNLAVTQSQPQTAVSITVGSVLLWIEGVHLIIYEHGHVHVTIPVKVYWEPEQFFLILFCKDLFYFNHCLFTSKNLYRTGSWDFQNYQKGVFPC